MSGGWARLRRVAGARAALVVLGAFTLLAATADLLASDLPLAVRVDGALHLLPCIVRPPALADDDQQSLALRAEWLLPTPVPYGPLASRPGGVQSALAPPSRAHWLGTDDRGRDVLARMVHGARTSLAIAVAAALAAALLGLAGGLACGFGPRVDWLVGRVVDVAASFPVLFFLLALEGASGSASLALVVLGIALVRWPEAARLVRASVLRALAAPHVEAARGLGASPLRIVLRHLLPVAAAPALVAAALGLGQAVLIETGLGYLGLGVAPPRASLGELFAEAHASGLPAWLLAPPAVAVAIVVSAAGRLADGLSALLDPARA